MRATRPLVLAGLAALFLAPSVGSAQSDPVAGATPTPLALQPRGRLPLQGTPWRLEAYHDRGRDGVPGPEVAAFLTFGPSALDGSGGCSRIRGSYGVVGSALQVDLRRIDRPSCTEQLMLVQLAVENGLGNAASVVIEAGATAAEDKLVIRSLAGEEVLRYGLDDVAGLDWAEWRLLSYTVDGRTLDASDEQPAVVSFRPDEDAYYKRRQAGTFSGSSGCNGFVAEFHRQADVLGLSGLQRTDAPCTLGLTAQEEAMANVLGSSSIRLDLPYDALVLTSDDDGEQLRFALQAPLEGTTWWLRETAAAGAIDDQRLTMRLDEGRASGEGPCGPFSAEYVTDGTFITFDSARGARDDACAELRMERALISGLRRSVRVARTSERLQFLDARGDTTLSFDQPFGP